MGNELKPKKPSLFKRLFTKEKKVEAPVQEQNNIAGETLPEQTVSYDPNDFVMLQKKDDLSNTQNIPVNSLNNQMEDTLDVEPLNVVSNDVQVSAPQVTINEQQKVQQNEMVQMQPQMQFQPQVPTEQVVQNEFVNTPQNVQAPVVPSQTMGQTVNNEEQVVPLQMNQPVNTSLQNSINEQPIYVVDDHHQGRSM